MLRASEWSAKGTHDVRLVVVLFVSFRVLALFLYRYGGFYGDASDYHYYYEFARLSDQGKFPLLHYWMEYPPIFPWLAVGAYQVSRLFPPGPHPLIWFQAILGGALLVAETGNLLLIYRIARRLADPGVAIRCAWIYATLFAPMFVWSGWFDSLPVFWLLLGLELLLAGRYALSGLACGIGFLVKIVPALLGVVVLRTTVGLRPGITEIRHFARFAGAASVVILTGLLPFAVLSPATFLASVRSWFGRAPWETFWALLDGYYLFGAVPSLAARLDLPSGLPWQRTTSHNGIWPLLLMAVAFIAMARLPLDRHRPRAVVSITALTLHALVLFSAGFSPQFVAWLMPFIVLLLPGVRGVVYATALAVLTLFVERYLYFNMQPTSPSFLAGIILARTLLIVALSVEYVMRLPQPITWPDAWGARARSRIVPMSAVALATLSLLVGLGPGSRLISWPNAPQVDWQASQTIRVATNPADAIVVADDLLYQELFPALMDRPFYLLSEPALRAEQTTAATALRLLAQKHRTIHLVRRDGPMTSAEVDVLFWLSENGRRQSTTGLGDTRLATFALSKPLVGALPAAPNLAPTHVQFVDFDHRLFLVGYALRDDPASTTNDPQVVLYWRVTTPLDHPYTLHIELRDDEQGLIGAFERQPMSGHLPVTSWQPGDTIVDVQPLPLSELAVSGPYHLTIGWSDPQTGMPLQAYDATGERLEHVELATIGTATTGAPSRREQ